MSVFVLSRPPAFQPCLAQFQGSSVERTGWEAARPLFPTQYHRADRSLINLICRTLELPVLSGGCRAPSHPPRKSHAFLSRPRTHDKALYRKAVISLAWGPPWEQAPWILFPSMSSPPPPRNPI